MRIRPDSSFYFYPDLDPYSGFYFNVDPNPAFHSNVDPDPASKNNAKPSAAGILSCLLLSSGFEYSPFCV
jgi:hypothetical protein